MVKILIVRLSSLGDIIHTYPMLMDIKANFNCSIDWLVDESFVELIKLNKLIDTVISIPLRKWKKSKLSFIFHWFKWKKDKSKKYDYIIDCQGLLKSAILTKCFKGKVYGLGKGSIKEKLACLLYDYKIETGKDCLAITKNRLLAKEIFAYHLNLNKVDFGLNEQLFPRLPILENKQYVIFFHATSKNSKKYPIAKWAELGKYVINKHDFTVVVPYGSPLEKEESLQLQKLIGLSKVYVPENKFNYYQLASLISKAEFIWGVDTGLIHLSNALNKKLIAIYTNTNPAKTGIFESSKAKNIGNKNEIPNIKQVIDLFEKILKD